MTLAPVLRARAASRACPRILALVCLPLFPLHFPLFCGVAPSVSAQAIDANVLVLAEIPAAHRLEVDPVFSPVGPRFGYVATTDGGSIAVVDGVASEPTTFADTLRFSADGAHYAYRAGKRTGPRSETWWIVRDGKRLATHDWVGSLAWAPKADRLAYWIGDGVGIAATGEYTGGKYAVVLRGKRGTKVDDAGGQGPPILSDDGKRVAYVANKGRGGWVVVFKNKLSKIHRMVAAPAVSANGKRCVFPAMIETGKWRLFDHRGKAVSGTFDDVGSAAFSKQGWIAHPAAEDGKYFLVVKRKPQAERFSMVRHPVFSPNGRRIACCVNRGGRHDGPSGMPAGIPPALARMSGMFKGGNWFIMVDGKVGEPFQAVGRPWFGPKGRIVAHRAKRDGKWHVVVNGRAGAPYDAVSRPWISEDGKTLRYGARDGRKLVWVEEGIDGA